jgi:hypothetical protein
LGALGHRLGKEHHRRDADPAADQQRPASSRRGRERPADRAEHADVLAGPAARQQPEPLAEHLEQQLDHARAGVGAHQRQRPAHRQGRIAADVRETARPGMRRALRGHQPHHVLLAGPVLDVEQFGVLEEDGGAVGLAWHHRG